MSTGGPAAASIGSGDGDRGGDRAACFSDATAPATAAAVPRDGGDLWRSLSFSTLPRKFYRGDF